MDSRFLKSLQYLARTVAAAVFKLYVVKATTVGVVVQGVEGWGWLSNLATVFTRVECDAAASKPS